MFCLANGFVWFFDGARPATRFRGVRWEALEIDLERGKPFFRRKTGKTRYLDGLGHKGLADFSPSKKKDEKVTVIDDMVRT